MAVRTPPQSTQAAFFPDSGAGGVSASQGGFHAALFILPAPHDATASRNPADASSGSPGDRPRWMSEQAAAVNYLAPLL